MAKSITVSIPHKVTREDAKRRVMSGLAEYKTKFATMAQIDEHWTGDHMDLKATGMGQTVTARLDITDNAVVVQLDLPWMFAMMAGRIQGELETEGRKLLQ
ncbi:MAG TPA: polyhydroxyalkanoic acid system family protein [Tepidisphaeraceae bacterium]|jgi:putative polyhydroxyalkanoate system protein|nr:polyhydroxyalkanoic acid system family protein [Tepidisphaeraceae bacterium]